MHADAPEPFWYWPAAQLLHEAWDPWFWNCPFGQLPQDPVPLVPAAQPEHAVLPLLTAHPAPDLQLVPVCAPSCHVLAGHAPQTMLAVVEHAVLRFCPAGHVAHVLHADVPVWSCHVCPETHATQLDFPAVACRHPDGQFLHDVWLVVAWYLPLAQFEHDPAELLCPFAHAAHPVLAAFTVQPAPLLHAACCVASCHWPLAHALQPVAGVPLGRELHTLPHVMPEGQWGWCGWCGWCGWWECGRCG